MRHYAASELEALLLSRFPRAEVKHGEIMTTCWRKGLGVWKPGQPVAMAGAMLANLIHRLQNARAKTTALNSARLFATAWKA